MLAPNNERAVEAVGRVERVVNDWLVKISFGESSIGLSKRTATSDDFVLGRFPDLWDGLQQDMERKKCSRVDLETVAGSFPDYLDNFDPTLEHALCPLCCKETVRGKTVQGSAYIEKVGSACAVCRDHVFLGTNLVKKSRVAITACEADLRQALG